MNEAPPKDVASAKPARPLIMVVDDDAEVLELCDMLLDRAGYDRVLANSGEEAVSLLEANTPSLMVLDLNMPDMHGLDVIRFLRSHDRYRDLPVIVLTTRGDESSRQAAIEAGASQYLTKPFAPSVLLSSVRELLDTRVSRRR